MPGWFQATLALYDAPGREVAYDDDYRFHPDPVLHCEIPADGEYVLEIKDAIYRGREDFVYRIAVGELPFVTSIFPLGGPAGAKTAVQVAGWNLPDHSRDDGCDGRRGRASHPVPPPAASYRPTACRSPSTRCPRASNASRTRVAKDAQRVTLPVIVNGRIEEPGDVDVFSFEGRRASRSSPRSSRAGSARRSTRRSS